ncbi:MAG: HAMP domain-containing sensor histidine kinase [Pseudanabaena sp. ELA607]|jgi:signal transduction histidine kinase
MSKVPTSYLHHLRNRLLFSYWLVTAIILGIFSGAVYLLVAHDRNQQLNLHLHQVAESSIKILDVIYHEYHELITEEKYRGSILIQSNGKPSPITLTEMMSKYERDSAMKSGIKPTMEAIMPMEQGVEWYDRHRHLMIREGGVFLETALPETIPFDGLLQQHGSIRSFIHPVYQSNYTSSSASRDIATKQVFGYVRVTESTLNLELELNRLSWSLGIGVMIVAGLAALGGIWLTRESIKPVIASFHRLQQFTADASHELRNPLTAIRASIAVMQSHPERIHAADVAKLTAMATATAQMSQLVDDLLLLARTDQQIPDRQSWREIPLDEMLEDLVDSHQDQADAVQITLVCSDLSPTLVYGDPMQFSRLFRNLLANALQYTPPQGTIKITCHRDTNYVLVSVSDTGIGIAPEHLEHIFERFWRADQARSQYGNGSGLGLSIVKMIARGHGGDVTVRSTVGVGSCFEVKIPSL